MVRKNINMIITILTCSILLVGCADSGTSKLYNAIEEDNLELAKEAVNSGCSIDKFNGINATMENINGRIDKNPVYASIISSKRIAQYLIEEGADVNYQDKDGISLLMLSAYFKDENLCKLLIEKNADLTLEDKNGQNVMDYALKGNTSCEVYGVEDSDTLNLVKLLLKNKDLVGENTKEFLIKGVDGEGSSVGHKYDVLNWFINNGTIKLDNLNQKQQFFYAASQGDLDKVKKLEKQGVDIKSYNSYEENILMIGAKYGKENIVDYAIKKGLDIYEINELNQFTPLNYATYSNNLDLINKLLSKDMEDSEKLELIEVSLDISNLNIIETLIDKYMPDLNYGYGDKFETVLYHACNHDRKDIVTNLINKGAEVNGAMLSEAVYADDKELLQILLDTGINVDKVETYSDGSKTTSALASAMEKGDYEIVEFLLKKGAKSEDAKEMINDDWRSENIRKLVKNYLGIF